VSSETPATKAAKRLAVAISTALTEKYDRSPGKVDSMSRVSYVLGLQKALSILMEEIKAENEKKEAL
jgi:acyl carrier protein